MFLTMFLMPRFDAGFKSHEWHNFLSVYSTYSGISTQVERHIIELVENFNCNLLNYTRGIICQ